MSRTGDEKIWSRINWLCYAHNKGEGSCTYGAERYRPPRNARRLTEDLQREGDESIYLLIVPKSFCLEEDEKMMKKKREEKKRQLLVPSLPEIEEGRIYTTALMT